MNPRSDGQPRVLPALLHAWRFDQHLAPAIAERSRRSWLITTGVLGGCLTVATLAWGLFGHTTQIAPWPLVLLSLALLLIMKVAPPSNVLVQSQNSLRLLSAALLVSGGVGVLLMIFRDVNVGVPAGALLGAGAWGLWRARPRRNQPADVIAGATDPLSRPDRLPPEAQT